MQHKLTLCFLALSLVACGTPATNDVPTPTDTPTADVTTADMPTTDTATVDSGTSTDVPSAMDTPSPTDTPAADVPSADAPNPVDTFTPTDTPNPIDVPMRMGAAVVPCAGLVPAATVTAPGFAFTPMMTNITAGQVVLFDMPAFHDAVSNDMLWDADFNRQTCVRFTIAGTYDFRCVPHGFTGSIVVR